MLTGGCPFAGGSVAQTQSRVLTDPLPRLRDLRPEIDPRLASIVEACLQKDRSRRLSSMAELSAALQTLQS
jgi:serine/threonine-protein kinase